VENLVSSGGMQQLTSAQAANNKIADVHTKLTTLLKRTEVLNFLNTSAATDPTRIGPQLLRAIEEFLPFADTLVAKSKLIPAEISGVHPDWAHLVIELQNLVKNKSAWSDFYTSSIGQTLLELMAAVGVYNQLLLENAYRESFLATAIRDSSVYALASMLGVRIARKNTPNVRVRLNNSGTSDAKILPYVTKFEVGGQVFFADHSYSVLPAGLNAWSNVVCDDASVKIEDNVLTLYEGTFHEKSMNIEDDPQAMGFFQIRLNEPNWQVANNHLLLSINDERWFEASDPLWLYDASAKVFFSTTSGDGDVVITFGDGLFGKIPKYGDKVRVGYIKTTGSGGNVGVIKQQVTCQNITTLSGITTSIVSGGVDQKSSMYYKLYAPHVFKARGRAITKTDYRALILTEYTGSNLIASLAVQGQRDIAPFDLRWMNTVRLSILPHVDYQKNTDLTLLTNVPSFAISTNNSSISETDYNLGRYRDNNVDTDHIIAAGEVSSFFAWLGTKNHYMIDTTYKDPVKLVVDLKIEVAILKRANASVVVENVVRSVKSLFYRKLDTLGKEVLISDIMRSALVDNVDYAILYELRTILNSETTTVSGDMLYPLSQPCFFNSLLLDDSGNLLTVTKDAVLDTSKKISFFNNKLYFSPEHVGRLFKVQYHSIVEVRDIHDFTIPKDANRDLTFFELGCLTVKPFFSER